MIGMRCKRRLKRLVIALAAVAAPVAVRAADLPPLAIYGNLPGFEMAALSPSGDHIAVLATVAGQRKVVVLDAGRKPVFQVAIDAGAKLRGLHWAGDQWVLIETSATVGLQAVFTTDKAELGTVLVLPLDGSKPWAVFAGDDDITGGVRGSYGVVRKRDRWFAYFGGFGRTSSSLGYAKELPNDVLHPDIYEVDLATHRHRLVAPRIWGEHQNRDWLIDGQGEVGAVLDLSGDTGRWALDNGRGRQLASGTDLPGTVSLIGFTPDGSGVVYRLRDAADARDLWFSVPLAGGPVQPFLEGITVQRWFRDSGHRLTGYIADNANNDGHFFDSRADQVYKASQRAFHGERMILDDANAAFNRLLVTTEGPGDPATRWLVDIATGHADPLGAAYAIRPADVGLTRMVAYTAADGLKMEGVLTLPPGRNAKALAAVILPHGGPAAYDTLRFDWLAQAFASRGFAVFQPNFRGSTGYGTAFEVAGNGEWGRKMQTDLSDGLAELVRQGLIDPARVCIVGASYGGYAALAGLTLQQGVYRCAVAIAGISDLDAMVRTDAYASGGDPVLRRNLRQALGPGQDLKAISPIRFADKVAVPVLLIHGNDDTVVKFSQSADMADALRRAGKPVEFVTLKAEDHWLSKGETRLQMLQASVDFVIRNNPPDAAPSQPAKPAN